MQVLSSLWDIKVGDTVMITFDGEFKKRPVHVETLEWKKLDASHGIMAEALPDFEWLFINGRAVMIHGGWVEKIA